MSFRVSSLPPGFSWLNPACRPTPREVDLYARLIADAEGCSPDTAARLHREAELQLWAWRTEHARRHAPVTSKRRTRARPA